MVDKGLFLLVEGPDDERLLQHIYSADLQHRYQWVKVYKYAQQSSKMVTKFIQNIPKMNADYLFFADIDLVSSVKEKKAMLQQTFSALEDRFIQVVVMEIESWYIAGISPHSTPQLHLKSVPTDTNKLTKEQFNTLIPSQFDSRRNFMQEILKHFSYQHAQTSNQSFAYFAQRYH